MIHICCCSYQCFFKFPSLFYSSLKTSLTTYTASLQSTKMQPSVIVCLLGSLVPALAAVRQDQPGPCDPDPCYRVIDSAACWSAVLLGTEKNASKIFDCVPGGKEEVLFLEIKGASLMSLTDLRPDVPVLRLRLDTFAFRG